MDKYPTKKMICLLALAQIGVTPAFCQPAVYAEGRIPPIRSPVLSQVLSLEDQTLVGQQPKVHSEWTWMTSEHATHLLQGAGYSNDNPLQKKKAHWQGIVTKENGHPPHFVDINRYGKVSTLMGSDIVQRWPRFSSEDVLALKDREDLIEQVQIKYNISTPHAGTEVDTFFNDQGF